MAVKITMHRKKLETAQGEKIYQNDGVFDGRFKDEGYTLSKEDESLMKEIDKAIPVKGVGHIETPYGITDITHLSTGLKTLLNIRYYIRTGMLPLIVDITECGANVLGFIFKEVDNQDVLCILRHTELPYLQGEFDFLVGDKLIEKANMLALHLALRTEV